MTTPMTLQGTAPASGVPLDLDAAHVAAMAQTDATDRARDFLAATADLDPDALAAVIFRATAAGWGTWISPNPAPGVMHRPATHMVEIDLFGIPATGPNPAEAARNWRTVARRLTGVEDCDGEAGN